MARIVEALWRARPPARRYGGTSSPSFSGALGLKASDAGFTLLDVVVAITVLMVVLLPVAYLLSTTSKTEATNQERLTAQSVAASWLEQERTAAEQSPSSPPSISYPGGTTSNPTWPSSSGTEQVGNITYNIYLAGGWCAYSGAGNAWTNGTVTTTTNVGSPTPLSYFIAVKVAWGPDAGNANPTATGENDGMVVEYSAVPSGSGWTVTEGASNVSVLTLTNTSAITNNICPLSLGAVA